MGKIRVKDLAERMNVSNQDLLFKLRSIGVRVEGDEASIDSDIIQAIIGGKKLRQPREVILRDDAPRGAPARTVRRRPPGAMRPPRRQMIQRVEPRPRNIEVKREEKPETAESQTPQKPAETTEVAAKTAERATQETTKPTPPQKKAPSRPSGKASGRAVQPSADRGRPTRGDRDKPGLRTRRIKETTLRPEPRRRAVRSVGDRSIPEIAVKRPRRREEPTPSRPKPQTPSAPPQQDPRQTATSARGKRREERRQEQAAAAEQTTTATPKQPTPSMPGDTGAPIVITESMTVRDFAEKLDIKAKDLIKMLVKRGILASINHVVDPAVAEDVAQELGRELMEVTFEEEVQLRQESAIEETEGVEKSHRPPVVTVMGHVDHGKTTLLDAIRSADVASGEAGGITQHIGAYQVTTEDGKRLTFIDTPGHEAFTMMRARGAKVTDIVILVVAADDGVMPQTLEAIDHARAANVPIVVAINKVDRPNANLDKVKKELSDHGLLVEDWGGDIVAVPLSALKREGIDDLLEMILLNAELLELKAAVNLPANGIVLEARKEVGRGVVTTVIVQEGALSKGDIYVAGSTWGRVRSMTDHHGETLEGAGPATPVEVTGWDDVPSAGDVFQVVANEQEARSIADYRRREVRQRELAPGRGRMSLDQLFETIQEDEVKELPVVIKADVLGSVEVLRDTLEKASTEKVKINVIHGAVGAISTNDVGLASASDAIIVGFNVRPERKASTLAEAEGVDIRLHTVIYELTDEIRRAMVGLLEPTFEERMQGTAEVRQTFSVPKIGVVAGCHVTEGTVHRSDSARLLRDNVVIYEGKLASLRRFKDDASEVRHGFDCGIGLERFQDVKPGDIIETYTREEVAATL